MVLRAMGGGGGASTPVLNAAGKLPVKNLRLMLPPRIMQKRVMTSPPTITNTTSHGITTPREWRSIYAPDGGAPLQNRLGAGAYAYLRAGNPQKRGTAAFDEMFVKFNNVNYGDNTSDNGYCVSVLHYGSAIEFGTKGLGGQVMCRVDDEWITLTPLTVAADGGEHYYYIPFGSAKLRRVDFFGATAPFSGIFTAATDTLMPAPVRGPRCIVIGDSFTEGTGATGPGLTDYVHTFAQALGWDDVWASGVGSTGYLAAPAPKLKYRDRVATDIAPFNPEVVFITGGYNDSAASASAMGTEADLLFKAVKAAAPTALVVVVAPFASFGVGSTGKLAWDQVAALKAAALANGCLWISLTEMPLLNGQTIQTAALAAAASANAATISVNAPLTPGNTFAFPDGTRFMVKAVTGTANGPWTVTPDANIQTAQASGAVLTQVGNSLWTGNGRVGATNGSGNCDVIVGSDTAHPTQAGHEAIGNAMAMALLSALSPN